MCFHVLSFFKINYVENRIYFENVLKTGYLINGISKPTDLNSNLNGDISVFGNMIFYGILYKIYTTTSHA